MESVQFQIVPCSSLYLFSRSTGPLQCLVNVNYKCFNLLHLLLPVVPSLLILASSVCRSLWCLISALTQGGEGGHLFRLTCSVGLWGGRKTANKYRWHVWGVLRVYGPHWVCPRSQQHVLSRSTLLRLQRALQGTVQSGPCISCTSQV